jgi:bifunctional ADP-heptose synthase (sugar kinase/adenylyltransferase)
LDTRTKIISQEEALQRVQGQQQPAQWVAGNFDPLLAEHVRLLRGYVARNRRLVVEITNPPRPLLTQRARAELVAALGMVDYVVLKDGEPEVSQDADITERFIQHVLRRHHPEGTG